jgi:pyruvate formate lyase activating enzyme
VGSSNLAGILAARVREAELYEPIDRNRIRCLACGHCCPISDGQVGVCKVRFNRGGKLYAPWGYVAGAQLDPIEKKPFFHALPGSSAFSFGMLGCDLHCSYCQNWISSQTLRDPAAEALPSATTPEELVRHAVGSGARTMISTYNEPLITAEWSATIFQQARAAGLLTGFVSNGNATPQALEFLRPHLDMYKVDLKSFRDENYRRLGGRLGPILESIKTIHRMGIWLEIVTLVVPDFNDSTEELQAVADFLVSVSPDIPWHVTAFHPDYKMADRAGTPVETLRRAAAIGKRAGLRYVYAGNLPGADMDLENTRCASCGATVIRRWGFRVLENRLGPAGACPECRAELPGVWSSESSKSSHAL